MTSFPMSNGRAAEHVPRHQGWAKLKHCLKRHWPTTATGAHLIVLIHISHQSSPHGGSWECLCYQHSTHLFYRKPLRIWRGQWFQFFSWVLPLRGSRKITATAELLKVVESTDHPFPIFCSKESMCMEGRQATLSCHKDNGADVRHTQPHCHLQPICWIEGSTWPPVSC